jgi:hypothetical protein
MSVKRRDLIKYFEEGGFYLLRESGNTQSTRTARKQCPSKDIVLSTESPPTSCANKLD